MLLGEEGNGWHQVTAELAFERSGPERFLSTYPLVAEFARRVADSGDPAALATLGRLSARLLALRQLSLRIAAALDRGELPDIPAALVKDVGTTFEGDVIEEIRRVVDVRPSLDSPDPLAPGAGRGAAARAGLHAARRDQRDPAGDRGAWIGAPVNRPGPGGRDRPGHPLRLRAVRADRRAALGRRAVGGAGRGRADRGRAARGGRRLGRRAGRRGGGRAHAGGRGGGGAGGRAAAGGRARRCSPPDLDLPPVERAADGRARRRGHAPRRSTTATARAASCSPAPRPTCAWAGVGVLPSWCSPRRRRGSTVRCWRWSTSPACRRPMRRTWPASRAGRWCSTRSRRPARRVLHPAQAAAGAGPVRAGAGGAAGRGAGAGAGLDGAVRGGAAAVRPAAREVPGDPDGAGGDGRRGDRGDGADRRRRAGAGAGRGRRAGRRGGEGAGRGGGRGRSPGWRTRCTARSGSPRSTGCTTSPGGCGRGGTRPAASSRGRGCSRPGCWPTAPTGCGPR